MSIFSWKMSAEERAKQLQNYDTLKITESYRGISALLIVASTILTVVLSTLVRLFPPDAIYGAFIYLPVAFFIYKGHKWAMILMIVLWTFEKGYQIISVGGTSPFIPALWWFLFMNYFVNALRIEFDRNRSAAAAT